MASLEIQHYTYNYINAQIYQRILDQQLYDRAYCADKTGLHSCCINYFASENRELSHVWFARLGRHDVGIAAVRHYGNNTLNVYVKPEYRRVGVGSQLTECALSLGVELHAIYTASGTPLYRKYAILDNNDYCP